MQSKTQNTKSQVMYEISSNTVTVKPVLSSHSKLDKTKILMTNGSLMQVKNICRMLPLEHFAILLTCIK